MASHEVRKSAKRLRYAAESARPVFRSRAKRLACRAEALQELLGEHQDTVVARGVLRELGVHAAGPATTASPSGECTRRGGSSAELENGYPKKMATLPRKNLRSWLRG